jgi:hypothetical protein
MKRIYKWKDGKVIEVNPKETEEKYIFPLDLFNKEMDQWYEEAIQRSIRDISLELRVPSERLKT